MDRSVALRQRLRNWLHGASLLAGMGGLFALTAWLLGGPLLTGIALTACFVLVGISSVRGSHLILRLHGARPVHPSLAPELYAALRQLAARADLPAAPSLYLVPSTVANAFGTGSGDRPAIALSEGLLRCLPEDEVIGVLAHEVAHLSHDDIRLMAMADTFGRLSVLAVNLVVFALLLNLPLLLVGLVVIPLPALLLLLAMPTMQLLMQLGFSRSREFAADLKAAELLEDPGPLARALISLERQRRPPWWWTVFGDRTEDGTERTPWLRSHPSTEERVQRLQALRGTARSGRHVLTHPVWS